MSLFDNVRQTLEHTAKRAATRAGEAATTAREVGQNLGAQAQAQLNIKKLQVEHTKTLRELGERTYAWYQSGQLIVSGPVPDDVRDLLHLLDDSGTRLRLEEAKLDEARRQAEARSKGLEEPETYTVLPDANTTSNESQPMNTHNTKKSTQKLSAEGVTMPGTGIITNPTPPVSDPETIPTAVPSTPAPDTSPLPIPSDDTPIPSPMPDGAGGLGGGTGVGIGTGIGTPGSIPGGTF